VTAAATAAAHEEWVCIGFAMRILQKSRFQVGRYVDLGLIREKPRPSAREWRLLNLEDVLKLKIPDRKL
jgi:hypothetical protein